MIKKYCNSEEGKLQKSKTAKILWQNEEYADLVRHKVKVAKNDPLRKEIRTNGAKLSHVTRRKNKELNNAN